MSVNVAAFVLNLSGAFSEFSDGVLSESTDEE